MSLKIKDGGNVQSNMRSEEALHSFMRYCFEHPDERFWQALRNWSKYEYILGYDGDLFDLRAQFPMIDTFHLEGLDGIR